MQKLDAQTTFFNFEAGSGKLSTSSKRWEWSQASRSNVFENLHADLDSQLPDFWSQNTKAPKSKKRATA